MIETSLFPYGNFPYRLEFGEKKNLTVCWFECEEHLQKYLTRYKLDKRTIKVDFRDAKPTKSGKTNKNSLEQGTAKKGSRGASGSKRGTKKLDSTGTVRSTRKPKSK